MYRPLVFDRFDSLSEQVVGGRITESGRLGAFITKVKKGSLADVVGHLRAGELSCRGKTLRSRQKAPKKSLAYLFCSVVVFFHSLKARLCFLHSRKWNHTL